MLQNEFPSGYFDSIRPAFDHEVQELLPKILANPEIQEFIHSFLNGEASKEIDLTKIERIEDFKLKVVSPILLKLLAKTSFSLTSSGKSQLDKSGRTKYTYISNHRDIILDSAILNHICSEAGVDLPQIAIGDNLLLKPWIHHLVRLCDSFIVKRSPKVREMLIESKRLSDYMRNNIVSGNASQWIAQREGRAKNACDKTQTALLKMLTMSSKEPNVLLNIKELNIVPVAFSYEYDPCDYLKALELLQKELGTYSKEHKISDLLSMKTGLMGYKGRIHCSIGTPLFKLDEQVDIKELSKSDQLTAIANLIDEQIFKHYRFYPNNYIAYDTLYGGKLFGEKMYSSKEKEQFNSYIENQLDKLEGVEEHRGFLRNKMMEMYSTPLRNHLKTTKQL